MKIIDSHFHWWPRSFFDALCHRTDYPRAAPTPDGGFNYWRREGSTGLLNLEPSGSIWTTSCRTWTGLGTKSAWCARSGHCRCISLTFRRKKVATPHCAGTRKWHVRKRAIRAACGQARQCR